MEQLVKVQSCSPDGTARVLHIRQSACSGDCHKCSGCGAVQETMVFTAQNPIGAKPGDVVTVQTDTGPVLAAAAIMYVLPLVLFFLGCALGSLWGRMILTGGAGFALGIALAVCYDRLWAKKKTTQYIITGYGHFPKAWENEE